MIQTLRIIQIILLTDSTTQMIRLIFISLNKCVSFEENSFERFLFLFCFYEMKLFYCPCPLVFGRAVGDTHICPIIPNHIFAFKAFWVLHTFMFVFQLFLTEFGEQLFHFLWHERKIIDSFTFYLSLFIKILLFF